MARTIFTPAVVLRRVAYGEADQVLTLLTEAYGRVGVLARGARKSTRRFAGALEPFCVLDVEVALGRGELGRLAQARLVRAFPALLADLDRMTTAGACLELVRELLPPREPDPSWLPTVVDLLEALDAGAPPEELRIAFTLRFLALTGFAPGLERCGRCDRPAPPGRAALFDPVLGALVCRACGGAPWKLSGSLRARMTASLGPRWTAVEAWPSPEVAVARTAVTDFVTHHLGRRLRGGSAVAQVRELTPSR
ncbi:MAG: DNA repair protein RecO [Sandaracinaceae bacterium]